MIDPRHPGGILRLRYLEPLNISAQQLAVALNVPHASVSRLLSGKAALSSEMAVRLAHVLGGSPADWMGMQSAYDISQAKKSVDTDQLQVLRVARSWRRA